MITLILVIITVAFIITGCLVLLLRSNVQTPVRPSRKHPTSTLDKPKLKITPYTNSTSGPIDHKHDIYMYEIDEKKEKAIAAMKSIIQLRVKDYDGVIHRFIENAEKIKSPKVLFQKLTASSYDPAEYAKIISNDPVMATRLLRTVNSAAFGMRDPITDVKHAIVYLGANTVKNITMLISAEGMFSSDDPDVNEAYQKFWYSAFVASMLTLKVAQHLNFENPSMLSTAALLSFMGNVAYLNQYPEIAKQYIACQNLFDRIKIETRLNEVHAAAIAGELTKHWELPQGISSHIATSYDLAINPPQPNSDHYREAVLLYACCRLGEFVAFRELESLANFHFTDYEDLDIYYLEPHLQSAKITNLHHILKSKAIHGELESIRLLLNK